MRISDLTTQRLFDQIDFKITNENVLTSSFYARGAIPLILPNDKAALRAAFRASWGVNPLNNRFIRIKNTLHIEEIYISEALVDEVRQLSHVAMISELEEMKFNEGGYFTNEL